MTHLILELTNLYQTKNNMTNYQNNDTICAVSTPNGSGAIAVIRLSGSKSLEIIDTVFVRTSKELHHATCNFGTLYDGQDIVDEVVVSYFQSPRSYTGEDVIEISCHGSRYIQQKIMELLIKKGARYALPGEFTFRAFRHGKLDLAQSEAVADLIVSESKKAHDIAVSQLKGSYSSSIKTLRSKLIDILSLFELELDFGEEDVEFAKRDEMRQLLDDIESELSKMIKSFELGNSIKTGITVTIIGKPNVGKSTLLNLLLNEEKAIVSEIPGTTRDVIEDVINIDGFLFRFIDTAGLHETSDVIETIGIERTIERINQAEIILHVIDLENAEQSALTSEIQEFRNHLKNKDKKWILIGNKIDKVSEKPEWIKSVFGDEMIVISAKKHQNIELINSKLRDYVLERQIFDRSVVTNSRHFDAMVKARESIQSAQQAFAANISNELISVDIRQALYHLGSIIGEVTTEDVLETIFGKFCIGK